MQNRTSEEFVGRGRICPLGSRAFFRNMKARELGNSGLTVSPIGLGLAALGRPGYINLGHASDLRSDYNVAAMEERTHAVLDTAWKAGIRYFDAAR